MPVTGEIRSLRIPVPAKTPKNHQRIIAQIQTERMG
jgi:hypothetical protein